MTVVCGDTNWIVLFGLKNKVKKILPEADVYTCRNSTDALSIAREHGCDVLITEIDFGREKEEGIRLAQEMKELNPHVNIIFATASSAKDYAQQIVKLHYSGYLTKPFSNEELVGELVNLRYT